MFLYEILKFYGFYFFISTVQRTLRAKIRVIDPSRKKLQLARPLLSTGPQTTYFFFQLKGYRKGALAHPAFVGTKGI